MDDGLRGTGAGLLESAVSLVWAVGAGLEESPVGEGGECGPGMPVKQVRVGSYPYGASGVQRGR